MAFSAEGLQGGGNEDMEPEDKLALKLIILVTLMMTIEHFLF